MDNIIKKANKALGEYNNCIGDILKYIKGRIIIWVDEDYIFVNNLSIDYNPADGFILNDEEGKNYDVNQINNILKIRNSITVEQIKQTSI